jgi:hypothetical protein
MFKTMIRKVLILSMAVGLSLTTFACTSASLDYPSNSSTQVQEPVASSPVATTISDGTYPVQQATYDDGTGEYSLMLLNTKPGDASVYRVTNLPMARLTEEEISEGKKTYLKVENGQPAMYLTEDFRIEYVHNVTETQVNPQTGQQETVVVRRESNFWAPFAGALAGQAIGSLLFTPHYYMPPVYRPGVVLTGYGGYGRSYNDAVSNYRARYNAPPAEVKNRQTFRTTGQIRRSPSTATKSPRVNQGNRSTGSGYGTTDLRRSNSPKPSKVRTPSFGSGGARRRVGGRRR